MSPEITTACAKITLARQLIVEAIADAKADTGMCAVFEMADHILAKQVEIAQARYRQDPEEPAVPALEMQRGNQKGN